MKDSCQKAFFSLSKFKNFSFQFKQEEKKKKNFQQKNKKYHKNSIKSMKFQSIKKFHSFFRKTWFKFLKKILPCPEFDHEHNCAPNDCVCGCHFHRNEIHHDYWLIEHHCFLIDMLRICPWWCLKCVYCFVWHCCCELKLDSIVVILKSKCIPTSTLMSVLNSFFFFSKVGKNLIKFFSVCGQNWI